jgi:hypothetical protein
MVRDFGVNPFVETNQIGTSASFSRTYLPGHYRVGIKWFIDVARFGTTRPFAGTTAFLRWPSINNQKSTIINGSPLRGFSGFITHLG